MKRKLWWVFVLLVAAPLAGLGWLVFELSRDERAAARAEYDALLVLRLRDVTAQLARVLEAREREIGALLSPPSDDPEVLRQRARRAPAVKQLFVRAPDGRLVYPALVGELSAAEREFLMRTRQLWVARDLFTRPAERAQKGGEAAQGWYAFYVENDLGLIFWQRDASGTVRGAELERVRLLADLVAALPAQDAAAFPDGSIALVDARGDVVYRWGGYVPTTAEAPQARLPLPAPLGAWTLVHHVAPQALATATARGDVALVAAAGAAALVLVLLALWFWREQGRILAEAKERVSFVNQVSHELKTPLTNIRMYAELLQADLADEDGGSQRHVEVIVTESQRLSRLIANVLTFAKRERETLRLSPRPGRLDDVLREVVQQFTPAFEKKGLAIELEAGAPGQVALDSDAVSQILANLFSNVDKYAAGGKRVRVVSQQTNGKSEVVISDQGPGIPSAFAEKVFAPFFRMSDRVTEGASGTGIGLTLARELARLHGGDLVLVPGSPGATFRLTLSTPPAQPPAQPPAKEVPA